MCVDALRPSEYLSVMLGHFLSFNSIKQRIKYLVQGHNTLHPLILLFIIYSNLANVSPCKKFDSYVKYENIQHICRMYILRLNNLGKTDPSEIERIYNISKTADSVLLSLFTRTNGKCDNSHTPYLTSPSTGLSRILLSVRTQYSRIAFHTC